MKPVVSSLVALVIALAPLTAMAKDQDPAAHHAKSSVVHKKKKAAKPAAESVKVAQAEKSEKSDPIIRVKAGKKDGASIKPAVVHHAQNVDISGPGHREPKSPLVAASLMTKIVTPAAHEHGKTASSKIHASPKSEMPKLPANAGKPSKGGAEKGVKKGGEKKSEPASNAEEGQPSRDEELAELVAQIRGGSGKAHELSAKSAPSTETNEPAKNEWFTRSSKVTHVKPCSKEPVEIVRGPEVERFELEKCDGSIAPAALERFSILIRPGGAARPVTPPAELAKKTSADIAPGIRRVNPHLLERVEKVAEHFGKPGAPARFFVISGYRPASVGSMHSTGRAMDFRVDGVKNEDVVAFCKTLEDTGCGYYPNSSFVHMDVRDAGTGHTAWIDASGPGETPRYVKQWPPAPENEPGDANANKKKGAFERAGATEAIPESQRELAEEGEEILRAKRQSPEEAPPVPADEHPALPADSPEVTP